MEEVRYVGKRWLEAALMKYFSFEWVINSAILVDPRIEVENEWRYRTLQSAIDKCKDGSIIIVDVASNGVTDV